MKQFKSSTSSIFLRILTVFLIGLYFFLEIQNLSFKWDRAKNSALNHQKPNSKYLVEMYFDPKRLNESEIKRNIEYYKNVSVLLRDRPDTLGLQAFCYAQLGERDKAINLYKKAIKINPTFLGFYYNLGVLSYQEQRNKEAKDALEKAIRAELKFAILFVKSSSHTYGPILNEISNQTNQELETIFRDMYQKSYILLALIYEEEKSWVSLSGLAMEAIELGYEKEGLFHYMNGFAAFNEQNNEKCVYFMSEAIKQNPKNSEAYFYLALALKKIGSEKPAVGFLKKYESLPKINPLPDKDNFKPWIF